MPTQEGNTWEGMESFMWFGSGLATQAAQTCDKCDDCQKIKKKKEKAKGQLAKKLWKKST